MPLPIAGAAQHDFGPFPRLGYTGSPLHRAAERREDEDFLSDLSTNANTRAFVVGGEQVVLKNRDGTSDPLFTFVEAQALGAVTETVFLGLDEDAARFGIGLAASPVEAL